MGGDVCCYRVTRSLVVVSFVEEKLWEQMVLERLFVGGRGRKLKPPAKESGDRSSNWPIIHSCGTLDALGRGIAVQG